MLNERFYFDIYEIYIIIIGLELIEEFVGFLFVKFIILLLWKFELLVKSIIIELFKNKDIDNS